MGAAALMGASLKIYLLAGEPSGDKLGAALMASLKELYPDVEFRGVAGPLMQAEGAGRQRRRHQSIDSMVEKQHFSTFRRL